MSNVVSLCEFRKKKNWEEVEKFQSMDWAREYLEEELFDLAMSKWSESELNRTRRQAQMYPTDAYEAYDLIYKKRFG